MCCGMDKVLGENLYFGLCSYDVLIVSILAIWIWKDTGSIALHILRSFVVCMSFAREKAWMGEICYTSKMEFYLTCCSLYYFHCNYKSSHLNVIFIISINLQYRKLISIVCMPGHPSCQVVAVDWGKLHTKLLWYHLALLPPRTNHLIIIILQKHQI